MRNIKSAFLLLLISLFFAAGCGPKPYYKTKEGKKKLKYYNSIQYDREHHPRKKN